MKISLIARDIAPSQAFKLLAVELIVTGHEVTQFIGSGKQLASTQEERDLAISTSQAVVVGMSSSSELATEEISAVRLAKENGIPVFFYADSFGTYYRPWFREFLPETTLFVISEDEAIKARAVLVNTGVIVTGSPAQERFFFPRRTRSEVREQLELIDTDKMVLVSGGKDLEVNILHFNYVIKMISSISNIKTIISLHGGDTNPVSVYRECLDLNPWVRIIPGNEISGSDLLPGTDVFVGSATTLGVEAICANIPTVDYLSDMARERYYRVVGQDTWEPCLQGVAFDLTKDKNVLARILSGTQDLTQSRVLAEKLYPKPEKVGEAVAKMMQVILKS